MEKISARNLVVIVGVVLGLSIRACLIQYIWGWFAYNVLNTAEMPFLVAFAIGYITRRRANLFATDEE